MAPLSKRLRRIDAPRMAAIALAVPVLGIVAAYGYALTTVKYTPGGLAAAAGVVAIAGTGFLYAWRAVSGAAVE